MLRINIEKVYRNMSKKTEVVSIFSNAAIVRDRCFPLSQGFPTARWEWAVIWGYQSLNGVEFLVQK